jgi:hypothetical protein
MYKNLSRLEKTGKSKISVKNVGRLLLEQQNNVGSYASNSSHRSKYSIKSNSVMTNFKDSSTKNEIKNIGMVSLKSFEN